MRKFTVTAILVVILELALLIGGAFYINSAFSSSGDRNYRVEARRIISVMEEDGDVPDLTSYPHIMEVIPFEADKNIREDYMVEEVNGELYYFTYVTDNSAREAAVRIYAIVGGICIVSTILVFVYVIGKILRPFREFLDIPVELAKGNLTMPIKENKDKLFGKYLWGMEQLRSNIEQNKAEELRLLKDKKTLILSLSHDIKTPLSTIKLSSKALAAGLYEEEAKKQEVLESIYKNATDIEHYVGEIITASNEDFLTLTVNNGEFYLSEAMDSVYEYYKEKLALKHIDFKIDRFLDALVVGDKDRIIEVMQNVIENAIKYGDGSYIRIAIMEEEDCRLVKIANSGEQVSDEESAHLFDSFYRGSNTGNRDGSGLGLYIARKLMGMMDGNIYVDRSVPGEMAFVVVIRQA